MKIEYAKGHVDIEYSGKKARFFGDLGLNGFCAYVTTMKWMLPERDAPVSKAEQEEWINAINSHFAHVKDRILFVDDSGIELK